jgi:hypothetical protein
MDYEIVISCFREDLSWIESIPSDIDIIIYRKDEDHDPYENLKNKVVFKEFFLPNIGRETDTYLHHIINNYNNLKKHTIFTQGNPFCHNPNFLEFLKQKNTFEDLQPLSTQINLSLPPPSLFDLNINSSMNHFSKLKVFCPLISIYTLQPIHFYDPPIGWMYGDSLKFLNLKEGQSPIKELLKMCNFKLNFNDMKISSVHHWCMGAIFSVNKKRILQHSKKSYQSIKTVNESHYSIGYLMERSWMLLFDNSLAL